MRKPKRCMALTGNDLVHPNFMELWDLRSLKILILHV